MKVAIFAESYRPVINGAAVAVELLAEELERRGHAVSVFAPGFRGYTDPTPVYRFPSYTLRRTRDYPLAYPWDGRLEALFREARFDVVHTQSPFALGQVGRRWARRYGTALATTYHTLYVDYAHYARGLPRGWVAAYLKSLSRRYSQSCDAVAVPTAPIKKVLESYGVTRPLHVIPTGLRLRPPLLREPETRAAWGIPADARVVLYAGRLAREKNLELLFAGWARLARTTPEAWLLVAGNGPEEGTARRLAAASGAGQRVVFTGFLPPERMASVYAAADLFAFTSLTDTQGLVLTEAKAAGLPAVSVDAYGPGVVVKHGVDGLLTPNDPDAFAAALERVLNDWTLMADLAAGALREARRFSIEATAEAYERLYEEAIAAGR